MSGDDRRFEKGFFGGIRLPIVERYLYPMGRGRLFALGGLAAVVVTIPFLLDAFAGRAVAVSSGDLSTNHAVFAGDCATCHSPFEGATDAGCRSCHESTGDPMGVFSFERHYLYRSADFDRSAPSTSEVMCASCHEEHRGRDARLDGVTDTQCLSCHTDGDFEEGHSDFRFAVEQVPDPANLIFPHVLHVKEVMAEEELDQLEATCFSCHQPEQEGRFFQPISFEAHCDGCHLTSSTSTGRLPVRDGSSAPGVWTLEAIRAERGPGSLWADYTNPAEFQLLGTALRKRPVYHADPWILENLRRLRAELYPGADLADLLRSSADVPPEGIDVLYREAISTLRDRLRPLGGETSREVQREIEALEELLQQVEERLEDPFAPRNETRFGISVADRAEGLRTGALDEGAYRTVIDSLTSQCLVCHRVEQATVVRVQKDQRTLARAEFDHRAHVIHASCLDCHTDIPIREYVPAGVEAPLELDHSGIQNLPTISNCRSCHTDQGAPVDCVSCHSFHPDTSHWPRFSRYRTELPGSSRE